MMFRRILAISALVAATTAVSAQPRQEVTLTDGWQFSRDKQQWQNVSIPHDWAISGPFDKKWDLQSVAIVQNGETTPTEKSGRSGALPWIGKGYYKRTLNIPAGTEHAELLFDGAMAEPTVYINGKKAGFWAYGYNAFRVDITPFMKAGDNLLEVSALHLRESFLLGVLGGTSGQQSCCHDH
jgi:beta-galactosidase